jgi:peptidylprolyl isomerase
MTKLTQKQGVGVTVTLLVVFLFFALGSFFFNFIFNIDSSMETNKNVDNSKTVVNDKAQNVNNVSQLQIIDVKVGDGVEAKVGAHVTVDYVGTLLDGRKFDSSLDRGEPFTFTLGIGQVIKGWDLGVVGMKVGGERRLIIPASLAYGNQAIGDIIPAGSALIFEVKLIDVK